MSNDQACKNTDRELWREREGDYYADSIHVTEHGAIGINCGGYVYEKPIREWHKLAGGIQSMLPDSAASVGSGEILRCHFCHMDYIDPAAPAVDYRKALEEAVIAWSVCASLHREFCRKTDPMWTTRQADFVKHEADARALLAAQAPKDATPGEGK